MSPQDGFGLKATEPMPVVFLGHGSPMNAIDDNPYRRSWQQLGQLFGARWPRPALIVCVSAHWVTPGTRITAMDWPPTLHDFGGFPAELFAQQYPAPGAAAVARWLAQTLTDAGDWGRVQADADSWGLDHGAWGVLAPMFAQADVPVVQISLDAGASPSQFLALGQHLRGLRRDGVLIVGSGNVVHNLRALRWNASEADAAPWATAFDARVAQALMAGDTQALADVPAWGEITRQAHPTLEHFWPLLVTAGAAQAADVVSFFNMGIAMGSIGMRAVVWDAQPMALG